MTPLACDLNAPVQIHQAVIKRGDTYPIDHQLSATTMHLTRQTSLIILSAVLTSSLFFPRLTDGAEQWLSSLLLGLLVAVCLMVLSGCRHFLRD